MFLVCYKINMSEKPSAAWYLAPIFLGIIGSAIMWYVLKDEVYPDSPKMIKKGWVIGIVLTLIPLLFMIPMLVLIPMTTMNDFDGMEDCISKRDKGNQS